MDTKKIAKVHQFYFIHRGNLITVRAEGVVKANDRFNKIIKGGHKHELYHCLSV